MYTVEVAETFNSPIERTVGGWAAPLMVFPTGITRWCKADGMLEPVWTAQSNYFSNYQNERSNSRNLSCDNLQAADGDHRCFNWGETSGGAARILTYKLDALSLNASSTLLLPDLRDIVIPTWSSVTTADSPAFRA